MDSSDFNYCVNNHDQCITNELGILAEGRNWEIKNLQVICKSMDNLVNEFNRTYRDTMDEEMERENIVPKVTEVMFHVHSSLPQST